MGSWPGLLVLAHPFTETGPLPVAPAVLAVAALVVVLLAASAGSPAPSGTPDADVARGGEPEARTRAAPLSRGETALRAVAVGVLALGLVAGRLGPSATTRNLAPILLVVVGWPGLVMLSLAAGPVWRRVDPLDGLGRLLRAPVGDPGRSVWPAAPVALLVAGAAVVGTTLVRPAALATAIAAYVVVTLAGMLALGRRTWLERAEPVGLVLTWTGYVRGGRLRMWRPPPGAAAVLGAVAGALLFGLVRRSDVWSPVVFGLGPRQSDAAGVALFGIVAASLLVAIERGSSRRGRPGTATAAAVPVVAALTVAVWLAGGRLLVGARLLPGLLVDPLGRGWSLLGIDAGGAASPLAPAAVVWVQVLVLLVGGIAGTRLARARDRSATAATVGGSGAVLLVLAGMLLVSAH